MKRLNKYPIKALLRPPVEHYPAMVATSCSLIAFFSPEIFFAPKAVANSVGAVFLAVACWDYYAGFYVQRYQKNLRNLPYYSLKPNEIPVSSKYLFLGRGFEWTQIHTQRYFDSTQDYLANFVKPSGLYLWLRQKEKEWDRKPALKKLIAPFSAAKNRHKWWNRWAPLPPLGGRPALHGIEPGEKDMFMDLDDRNGHMLVLGTTRVGKTRFAVTQIQQDIRRGDVVIIFDPKGDADMLTQAYGAAKAAGREKDFFVFHLGQPDISARYNALGSFGRITEGASRLANQLPSSGNSSAFREFSWRFINISTLALVALGERPDANKINDAIANIEPLFERYCYHWLGRQYPDLEHTIERMADNMDERDVPRNLSGRGKRSVCLYQFIREHRLTDPVGDRLVKMLEYEKTFYEKLVSSLGPLLEKLLSGKTGELISPNYVDLNDTRNIFDWAQVIQRGGIVYVGLDALSDAFVASAIGASMFADLTSTAGEMYKHSSDSGLLPGIVEEKKHRICIHADEFNELIGPEFIPLINKAGGAGYQVTAYTQTWSDVEAKLGNAAQAGQIAGNFNTLVMLRVKEYATAEMLTKQMSEVNVLSLMQVTTSNDGAEIDGAVTFTSSTQDRLSTEKRMMIEPNDVLNLPKGQAFALVEGGKLIKLRFPLSTPDSDDDLPQNIKELAASMRKTYPEGGSEDWWTGVTV